MDYPSTAWNEWMADGATEQSSVDCGQYVRGCWLDKCESHTEMGRGTVRP